MSAVSRAVRLAVPALIGGWTLAWCGSGLPEAIVGAFGAHDTPARAPVGPFGPASLAETTWQWYLNFTLGVPLPSKGPMAWVTDLQRELFDRGVNTESSGAVVLAALGLALVLLAVLGSTAGLLVVICRRPNLSHHSTEQRVRDALAGGVVNAAMVAILAAHAAVFTRATLAIVFGDGTTWARLASAQLVFWGLGSALVVGLLLGLTSGRGWYERGLAGDGGCTACGYPLGGRGTCAECGEPARTARRSSAVPTVVAAMCTAALIAAALATAFSDPLRLAKAGFQRAYGSKALVLLVPGEATEVRVHDRWFRLSAVTRQIGGPPDISITPENGGPAQAFVTTPPPEGIDVGGARVLWMWDGPVNGAWKGLALVLVFDRTDVQDVRRALDAP